MDLHPEIRAILDPLEREQALRIVTQLGHFQGGNALFGGDLDTLSVQLRRMASHRARSVDGPVWEEIAALHEGWLAL